MRFLFSTLITRDTDVLLPPFAQARGHDHLAARLARDAFPDSRRRRQAGQGVLADLEELRRVARQQVFDLPATTLVLRHLVDVRRPGRTKAEPNRSSVGPGGEGEDHLAVIAEEQVALAERAAGQHLDGVHGAGVVLDDGDQFLVARPPGRQFPHAQLGRAVADHHAGAQVAVELHACLEIVRKLNLHASYSNGFSACEWPATARFSAG